VGSSAVIPRNPKPEIWDIGPYLSENVDAVVLQKLIAAQISQVIPYVGKNKG
jgi:hypothetical protein